MSQNRERGVSLVEIVITIAIILVVSSAALLNIQSIGKATQANSASELVIEQLRLARQYSISDRRVFKVTFTAPTTIRVDRIETDGVTITNITTQYLLNNIKIQCEPGIPTTTPTTPDHFGIGGVAIDFNGTAIIYFQPDGAARDNLGRISNGVVYISRAGDLDSARAVTLFGTTGRIKGWKLTTVGGVRVWQ